MLQSSSVFNQESNQHEVEADGALHSISENSAFGLVLLFDVSEYL
jgi:hypothetical protein